jgi:hypothetical protein
MFLIPSLLKSNGKMQDLSTLTGTKLREGAPLIHASTVYSQSGEIIAAV